MSLEIARVFLGGEVTLGRSIIFLFTDDEESGLDGSKAWIEDATVPVEDIVLGISADPLGRPLLPDYSPMVLIGLDRSPALEERFRELAWLSEVDVHFIHRDVVPVFSSDQDSFYNASWPVPAVWMTNPGFSFYHTVDDTAETIDYRMLLADGRFLAQVLAFFANDTERFDYLGPTEPGTQAAEDAMGLFSAVLDSDLLSESEREQAEYFQAELAGVIEADSMDALRHPESFFTAALYFLLFELGWAHPGEIPPPFPEAR
jgi:Zn-dependent M28 family amino/carboxypeptidase